MQSRPRGLYSRSSVWRPCAPCRPSARRQGAKAATAAPGHRRRHPTANSINRVTETPAGDPVAPISPVLPFPTSLRSPSPRPPVPSYPAPRILCPPRPPTPRPRDEIPRPAAYLINRLIKPCGGGRRAAGGGPETGRDKAGMSAETGRNVTGKRPECRRKPVET